MVTTCTAAAHAERVQEDTDDNAHKSHVPKKKVSDSTSLDTDVTLPVPTAVEAIMADGIQREISVFPNGHRGSSGQRLLAELD
jgi:hypothetical protein